MIDPFSPQGAHATEQTCGVTSCHQGDAELCIIGEQTTARPCKWQSTSLEDVGPGNAPAMGQPEVSRTRHVRCGRRERGYLHVYTHKKGTGNMRHGRSVPSRAAQPVCSEATMRSLGASAAGSCCFPVVTLMAM